MLTSLASRLFAPRAVTLGEGAQLASGSGRKEGSGWWRLVAVTLTALLIALGGASYAAADGGWSSYNHDNAGSRASDEGPSRGDVKEKGLRVRWSRDTPGTVTATPAVVDGVVYVGDTQGHMYALNAATGAVKWDTTIRSTGTNSPLQINSSALVADKYVVVGSQGHSYIDGQGVLQNEPGQLTALDRKDGHVLWSYTDADQPLPSRLTFLASPILARGAVNGRDAIFVGLASDEELANVRNPSYVCCHARSGVVALDPSDGHELWKFYTVPVAQQLPSGSFGPAGAAVWSTPTYDQKSHTVYISTGNNNADPPSEPGEITDTSDAIIALNSDTGGTRWKTQLTAGDTWTRRYGNFDPDHPDHDFGDSVNIFSIVQANGSLRKVVGAGQKSGFFHVLDATSGYVIDQEQVVPGGLVGGLFADSAQVGSMSFVNGTDSLTRFAGQPTTATIAALKTDATGITEQWRYERGPTLGGVFADSGVAVSNGVVYANFGSFFNPQVGFMENNGVLDAIDSRNGTLLASLTLPRTSWSGPSIADGRLYFGTGLDFRASFGVVDPSLTGSIMAVELGK